MSDEFELKPIHQNAIQAALQKAEQYRRLNEPGQAESICHDVLAIDPDNQAALRLLVLALTDKLGRPQGAPPAHEIKDVVARLESDYDRYYYRGILNEREAKGYLGRSMARSSAYHAFREAMECYEKAEAMRPEGNDDAILRWNSCVRAIRREKLRPRDEGPELPLE